MNFKKFFATVVASAAVFAPVGVLAQDAKERAHQQLWEAVQRVGVHAVTNSPNFCDGNHHGFYAPAERLLVVCQDNAKSYDGKMVPWSDNDFDTLRHEAHHIVQDCSLGGLGDQRETAFIGKDKELLQFIQHSGLTKDQLNWIVDSYKKRGANDHVIKLELEAFAVAASVKADTIAKALIATCGVR